MCDSALVGDLEQKPGFDAGDGALGIHTSTETEPAVTKQTTLMVAHGGPASSVTAGMTAAALLAPVPELLLKRSEPIVQEYGQAAFGSRAWEVFRRLDTLRSDSAVPVYIYASHPEKPLGPRITWTAVYIGHVDSYNGAYPGDPEIRPLASTDTEDQSRFWAVFWHVTDLQELPPPEWIDVGDIRNFKTDKKYGDGFVPEGPIIVGNP